ncbi:MAG: DUF6498-containing protein [Desulfobacterales bacterium]|jgi:hypothetical protein|nr:DUF6498-containing protein [Desulfobacterales bacterium]
MKRFISHKNLQKPSLSIQALTVANLVPLVGVVYLGWDAAAIVLLYWIENLIIGLFNVLRMILVKVESPSKQFQKLFMIPFFCVHFGGFCAVHGFFLLTVFKMGPDWDAFTPGGPWMGPFIFLQLLYSVVMQLWQSRPPGLEWPVLGLAVSHGLSFVKNFLFGQEYLALNVNEIMMRPYKRIVLMHVAIIAGGVFVMKLGSPVGLLCVLIFLKIGMDIWLHAKSHRSASLQ